MATAEDDGALHGAVILSHAPVIPSAARDLLRGYRPPGE